MRVKMYFDARKGDRRNSKGRGNPQRVRAKKKALKQLANKLRGSPSLFPL